MIGDSVGKPIGKCVVCINLRNTRLGTSCKVFGNPWERDLTKDCGCGQFYKPKQKEGDD